MSKHVQDMSMEERDELIKKLAADLKECNLSDVPIKFYRETVCSVAQDDVADKMEIKIEKKLPEEKEDDIKKFKEKAKEHLDGKVDGVSMTGLKCEVGPGSQYKTITKIVPVKGGEPMDLEHKEGEVWLIDFWATWCPPCQRPMQHNQDMLAKRNAEWGDKLKIIGISIDQTKEAVDKHVESKGWTSVKHYWRGESDCSQVYGVQGVPHVMIIDKQGKIAFKGHPATRQDLEKDFDQLLKGDEPLTGQGTASQAKPGQGDEDEDGKMKDDLDCKEINEEIDAFKKVAKEDLQKDEALKALAKEMPRSFCVMVFSNGFDPSTEKWKGTFTNYRVLVGKQDSIDQLKKAMDEKVAKGKYEIEMQEHAL